MLQWKQALQSHHLSNESSIQYDLPATGKWIKSDSQSKFINKVYKDDEYGMLSLKPKTRKLIYKLQDEAEIWSVGLRHGSFMLVVEDDRIKISFSNFRSNKTLMSATIRIVNGTPRGYLFDRRGTAIHKVRWLKPADLSYIIVNGMDRGNEPANEQSDFRHSLRYICAFFAQVAIALERMLKKRMHPEDYSVLPKLRSEFNRPDACGIETGRPLDNTSASNTINDYTLESTLKYWMNSVHYINDHIQNLYTVLMHPCVHYGTRLELYGKAYKAFRSSNISELASALLGSSGKGSRKAILEWFQHRSDRLVTIDIEDYFHSKYNIFINDRDKVSSDGSGLTPRLRLSEDLTLIEHNLVMGLINLRKHFSLNDTLGLISAKMKINFYPDVCLLVGEHISPEKFKRMVMASSDLSGKDVTATADDYNVHDIPRLIRHASERQTSQIISPPKGINTFNNWHDYLSYIVNSSTEKDYVLPINPDFDKFDDTVLPSGLRLVFPRKDTDLRRWGGVQNHCIGGYGGLILTNSNVIFCLYDGDIPMWCAQLTPNNLNTRQHVCSWRIAQFRGNCNTRANGDLYDEVNKHLRLSDTEYDCRKRPAKYEYFTEDGVDEIDIIQRDAVYYVSAGMAHAEQDLPF